MKRLTVMLAGALLLSAFVLAPNAAMAVACEDPAIPCAGFGGPPLPPPPPYPCDYVMNGCTIPF